MTEEPMMRLKSCDNVVFEVDKAVVFQSEIIKDMIEVRIDENPIPLPKMPSAVLAEIIKYLQSKMSNARKASSTMDEERKVRLKSSDNEIFEVDQAVAFESQTIKDFFQKETGTDIVMPLPKISSKVLAQIIDYWNSRANSDPNLWSANSWLSAQELSFPEIGDIIRAATYLDIIKLFAATTKKVVGIIKDMNPEEIRNLFDTPQRRK